jgi:hypothetical protein
MFNRSSGQILLKDSNVLVAKYRTPEGIALDSSLDLDNCLGNHDGRFIVGSREFSIRARDTRLDGNNLSAMLRRIDGSYTHDTIPSQFAAVFPRILTGRAEEYYLHYVSPEDDFYSAYMKIKVHFDTDVNYHHYYTD